MVIERDDIDPTTSLPRRVWVFQGPDRSTLALYQDASGGSVAVERILYTPMGMATFMDLGPTTYCLHSRIWGISIIDTRGMAGESRGTRTSASIRTLSSIAKVD